MVDWWNNKPPWNEHVNSIWLLLCFFCCSYLSQDCQYISWELQHKCSPMASGTFEWTTDLSAFLPGSPVHHFLWSVISAFVKCWMSKGFWVRLPLVVQRLKGGLIAGEVLGRFRGGLTNVVVFFYCFTPPPFPQAEHSGASFFLPHSHTCSSSKPIHSPTCTTPTPPPPLHPTLPSLESPVPVELHVRLSRVVLQPIVSAL